MDGRDFGPPRSVHGPPPPLLSGLAMDSHRVGAAGRLPATGLPGPLPPGKYMAGLNLHPHPGEAFLGSLVASGMGPSASAHGSPVPLPSDLSFRSPTPSNLPMVQLWAAHAHEGFSHLPSGLYPSYLHLNHLEPPSSGSPLLSQLGQPSIFDSQKGEGGQYGFYLPAPGPGALHPHAPSSRTPGGASTGTSAKGSSREGTTKERAGRGGEQPLLFGKKDPRAREEAAASGPRGIVDLTQEARADGRPDRGPPRLCPSPLPPSKGPPAPPAPGAFSAPPQPGPAGVYTIFPAAREPGREHRVVAPTFVPSVEACDERPGPIQIASQARDVRAREREAGRPGVLQPPPGSPRPPPEVLREKNSVIRSLKRPPPSDAPPVRTRASPDPRAYLPAKELLKPEGDQRPCERAPRVPASAAQQAAKLFGLDPGRPPPAATDHKWKPFELGNFATTQMAVLAAQHHQASRAEEEAASKKTYLDPGGTRACGRPGVDMHPVTHGPGEASAMQSLIKYSGSFPREAVAVRPGGCGKKSPFGGLGTMKPEPAPTTGGAPRAQGRLQHPGGPTASGGRQLKKDPERPESAKTFGREGSGVQGEAEVRHPPVGIAVAVARQKDSGGSGRLGPGLGDQERSLSLSNVKGHGRAEEGCADERGRHRDERLLDGRLDRDQEKLLRESKELADLARLHPTSCTANGLNPNLMVTGGPALSGSGRWSADPAAHLATHPWLPRSGSTSMWLAGHPYGLGPPSLHQGMAPAFPPGLGGSLPSAYQFVRDPQSGQLVVIPSDHLPHFADLMERAAPPLWSTLYQPGRSPLHHAQQLQLFSQQHFLRQQEFLYLQQQAAQALELQRSAQLVQERLKVQEHRAEMEEKVGRRSLEAASKASLAASGPGVLPRKPSAPAYSKSLSPPPPLSPRASPVAALKAKVIQKLEDVSKPPSYAYPATPSSHPSSPPPASPPPAPSITRKEEAPENVVEKKDLELEKEAPSPFQALFSDIPPRYPFPALPPHYGRPYQFLLQPTAAADADGLAPDVPLPAEGPERLALSPEDKPIRLSPSKIPEPLRTPPEEEPLVEREVKAEVEDLDESPPELPPLGSPLALPAAEPGPAPSPALACGAGLLEAQALSATGPACTEPPECPECAEGAEARVDSPCRTEACVASSDLGGQLTPETLVEAKEEPVEVPVDMPMGEAEPEEDLAPAATGEPHPSLELPDCAVPAAEGECLGLEAPEAVASSSCFLEETDAERFLPSMEDPLAGMNALAAAAELPQARPLPSPAAGPQALEKLEAAQNLVLEQSFLHGITLLSEIAELELEKRSREPGGPERAVGVRPSLESLLAASSHMLQEVLDSPFVDPLKNLRLPRELNPNKKYSWMQKKEERMYAMKSSLESMDAMELDFRMRLAELQRQYKEKQRELVKLQRHRDSEDGSEDPHRSLTRRGPGRPRKRTHALSALSPPSQRVKSRDSSGKVSSKSLLTSDDFELGAGLRKRHKGAEEEHDALIGLGKARGRSQAWDEHEPSDFMSQLKVKKKKMASDQEQLASKLDKALSLTKQDKLKSAAFKFSDSGGGKLKAGGGCSRYLTSYDSLLGKDRKALAKGLGLSLKASRDNKHKRAAKARKMEVGFKARGASKASHSPFTSEVSSYSYNTDSEEDEEFLKDEWAGQGPSGSKLTSSILCGMVAKNSKPAGGPKLAKRGLGGPRTLKAKAAAGRKQPFCLLLQEADPRSSFSDSSEEDSFDQDESSEEEDEGLEEEEDEAGGYRLGARERALSPGLEESGLGLLARFAASALPSPTVGPALSVVQLEAKQKARKKEERQSMMGTEFEYTDSESEVKVPKCSPAGLLRPKKGLGDPGGGLAGPAPGARGPTSPDKAKLAAEKGRKARKLRGPKEAGFEAGPEASDDDLWTRRRSERIFLHDSAPAPPAPTTAPAPKATRCTKGGALSPRKDSGRARDRKDPRKKKKGKESGSALPPPRTPALPADARAPHSSLATTKRSKAKGKGKEVKKENRGKGGAVSKLMESMAAEEDFEPNQDSSFSEDEHLPRGGTLERPLTPAPRSCVIDKDELKDGLRVLIPMDDKLLYAGHVQTVHSPDIYRVVVEGERGNRPHIYCLEQLLQEAIIDVRPASTRFLPQGTRIAAYWSQQYRCLYPGTVVRGLLGLEDDGDLITVEFDDGDTGRIPLSHIRLLPPDYKIQCAEPSPALLVPSAKRRIRKTSKDTSEGKDGPTAGADEPGAKAKGRGRKPSTKAKGDKAAVLEEGGPTDEVPSTPLTLEPISSPASKKSSPEPTEKRPKAPKARLSPPQPSPGTPSFAGCPAPEPFGEVPVSPTSVTPAPLATMPLTMPATRPKPKKMRAAEEPGAKGPRRPGEEAELLVKLDHEGVTSPKSKKAKEALLLREDTAMAGWQDPKGLPGLGSFPSAVSISEPKPGRPKALDGELPPEDSGGPESPDKGQAEQDGADESESSSSGDSSGSSSSETEGEEDAGKAGEEGRAGGGRACSASSSRPKKREGVHLPTTKELAKRQRLPSVENRPKIAAFLPARQLWKWFGKPTQRRGMKGKARKLFYKAIVRGKEMIRIGDCAVFLSAGRPNLPYIGRIQSMWESWGNNMVVRVKWFYHPEETSPGKQFHEGQPWDQKSGRSLPAALQASSQRKDFMERALYQSSHVDENDVQTVSHKCLVVGLEQYEQMLKTKKYQDSEGLYYLAGTYEPTTGMIFTTDGVPVLC
ncbi:PREDICTED: trinucleotide repeat-containing gene 18 protein [Elephantulus edwardii]|uniref:trinucleotide repeat-containing gene 18 protein n=1 Tax=Elephantulus edwardii TaxID=28737 RepID=UPI0003F0A63B|nr:PREDICTED: trinucleotide repeat-containing gene 18 protein [Elephantulus edwardii]